MSRTDLFFLIFNIILSICLGVFGILFCCIAMPYKIFDDEELEELTDSYNSAPLMNITKSTIKNFYKNALFGGYKGFEGGHKYKKCSHLFSGTCESDNKYDIYCPSGSEDTEDWKVDKKTCVDYYEIKSFSYDFIKDSYYYSDKLPNSMSYSVLLSNYTVEKNEKCPDEKKSCGLLSKEKKLCFPIEEECPINDIIINNQTEYSEDNIVYKSIIFGNDYIHYTNEKNDNQIILDLLLSIENPLSKIEISDKLYKRIFKLHELERESYFSGNIDDIRVYKKIFDTGITLQELFQSYEVLNIIKKEPNYKTKYLDSKLFIYKKYPVPLNGKSIDDVNNMNDNYSKAFTKSIIIYVILIMTLFFNVFIISKYSKSPRLLFYFILTIFHVIILILFITNIKVLIHKDILIYYKDKDFHRIQLLIFNIVYFIYAVCQNLSSIYIIMERRRESQNEINKPNDDLNENQINLLPNSNQYN